MYAVWSLSFLCTVALLQGSLSDQFNAALEAQNKKQYQHAFDLYCAIPVKTGNSIFNMGVIAYYEGQYTKAIALWRTACLSNSMSNSYQLTERVSCAIAQVKKEHSVPPALIGHPADDPRVFYHTVFLFVWYMQLVPLWIVQIVVLVLSILACGLLLGAIHNFARRRWILYIFFPLGIVICLAMYTIKMRTASYAIVQESIEMRRGPGDFFEPVGELSSLMEVLVETRASLWCKVRYQDKVGWVPEKALYVIDDHALCGIDIVNRSDNH
jgi:hypothetical protein